LIQSWQPALKKEHILYLICFVISGKDMIEFDFFGVGEF